MSGERKNAVSYESTRLADYRYDDSIERGPIDLPFAVLALLLLTIGVIMVLSSSNDSAFYTMVGNATN